MDPIHTPQDTKFRSFGTRMNERIFNNTRLHSHGNFNCYTFCPGIKIDSQKLIITKDKPSTSCEEISSLIQGAGSPAALLEIDQSADESKDGRGSEGMYQPRRYRDISESAGWNNNPFVIMASDDLGTKG